MAPKPCPSPSPYQPPSVEDRLARLEQRVEGIVRFHYMAMGFVAAVAFLAGLLPSVVRLFR